MDLRDKNNLLRETIAFPVRYDSKQQTIRDSKGMMVCDIRGWSKIQYMNRCEERQDMIGEKIVSLLNECKEEPGKLVISDQNQVCPGPKGDVKRKTVGRSILTL